MLVDKPVGWTSFDVVKKLKFALKVKKIGHAGTLDPLATGLLLIGTGKATKQLHNLQGLDKVYSGIIEIGKTTPSYDLETEFDSVSDFSHITVDGVHDIANKFTGELAQIPPAHSAVKIQGERAYKKARRKEEVVLKSRTVMIHRLDITSADLPEVGFEVHCSKGTYIRSLAHDFGQQLGVGAYLKRLRRVKIGDYHVENAHDLMEFVQQVKEHDNN